MVTLEESFKYKTGIKRAVVYEIMPNLYQLGNYQLLAFNFIFFPV